MAAEKILRLILGDQLNLRHSWFREPRRDVLYTMMEVRQETDYVRHHIQKVAGFFAAMRRFAAGLEAVGHRVRYLRLDDPENTQNIEENLRAVIRREGCARFEYLLPDEYRLDRLLAEAAARLPVPAAAADTEHFLTERDAVARLFSGKKRFLMESFYRRMRKDRGILLEGGRPAGGKWNYDAGNRSRYDGAVPIPPAMAFENDVREIVEMIDRSGVATLGEVDPERFAWPVTRDQALAQLDAFVRVRLPHFGTYQDAMTTRSGTLFHSRLSFALNTKMLHPMEVIEAALRRAGKASGPEVGISQLEGFVRQILGWREFVRGVYWAKMPSYETLNHFGHKAPLPGFYWTGKTRMACMRAAIGQSLREAYAHHIQRLMVTGNFALLAGVDPDAVDAWYLGIYIDAVQWVEIVNTRGMSQFADGGIVATKPYAASGNYIRRMSDYCEGCRYDPRKGAGEGACPFNSLYWDFLRRHRPRLEPNPRVAMMYRTWDRMAGAARENLLRQAEAYKAGIEEL